MHICRGKFFIFIFFVVVVNMCFLQLPCLLNLQVINTSKYILAPDSMFLISQMTKFLGPSWIKSRRMSNMESMKL